MLSFMRTILVDDEWWSAAQFEDACGRTPEIRIVGTFRDACAALDFARENRVDLAFLDVEMPKMNGIELAKELRKIDDKTIVIFVSAYDRYMLDAFKVQADYFVMKPYTQADVESVLERAKLLSGRLKQRVLIRTFGSFDVFVDGKPLHFSSAKAKELMALLVNKRGGTLGAKETFSLMWEDKPYDNEQASAYRRALGKLQDTLEEAGVGDILLRLPHGRALDVDRIDCDYYRFLAGDPKARAEYQGEYMSDYSWGEPTLASLAIPMEDEGRIKR